MARKANGTYHVIPNLDGGWTVKRAGASRASRNFSTKKDAVRYARAVSRNQRARELIVHQTDEAINVAESRLDPLPPRDDKAAA